MQAADIRQKARPQFRVTASTNTSMWYSSFLFAGLTELAQRGLIQLSYQTVFSRFASEVEGFITRLDVERPADRSRIRIAIDTFDKPMRISLKDLETCTVYFKSNLQQQYLDEIRPDLRRKILPFGMIYGTRSTADRSTWLRMVGSLSGLSLGSSTLSSSKTQSAKRNSLLDVCKLKLYRVYSRAYLMPRRVMGCRTISEFEGDPETPLEPRVVFLTRSWDPVNEDKRGVNEMRAGIIRCLRDGLGTQFVGGFADTPLSRELYPDCIATASTDPRAYTALVKNSLINVVTVGGYKGPAWRLPESLAGSVCVAAERHLADLPSPLEHGRELLFFDTPEECLKSCRDILSSAELAQNLRRSAQRYYQNEITPAVRLEKMLRTAEAFAA